MADTPIYRNRYNKVLKSVFTVVVKHLLCIVSAPETNWKVTLKTASSSILQRTPQAKSTHESGIHRMSTD